MSVSETTFQGDTRQIIDVHLNSMLFVYILD